MASHVGCRHSGCWPHGSAGASGGGHCWVHAGWPVALPTGGALCAVRAQARSWPGRAAHYGVNVAGGPGDGGSHTSSCRYRARRCGGSTACWQQRRRGEPCCSGGGAGGWTAGNNSSGRGDCQAHATRGRHGGGHTSGAAGGATSAMGRPGGRPPAQQPGVQQLGVQQPGVQQPGVQQPGGRQPDLQQGWPGGSLQPAGPPRPCSLFACSWGQRAFPWQPACRQAQPPQGRVCA